MNNYTFEVTTTQKCDMACTYCFEGDELKNSSKPIDYDIIMDNIEKLLIDETFMSRFDGIVLNFWGGEPTLNYKMIKYFFSRFRGRVNYFFYTNGYDYSKLSNIINYFDALGLDSEKLRFQISYDGIYDTQRIDHSGNQTSKQVLFNINELKKNYPEINITTKSTLSVNQLPILNKIINHFKDIGLSYSPTLEYTQYYDITPSMLDTIRKQFLLVAKNEIEYYKENKKFNFGWFESGEHAICSAGMNMSNLDLEGNLTICHGALYSDNKEVFEIGKITNFVESVNESYLKHKDILEIPLMCQNCVATVCYQCPIVNYDSSNKLEYKNKLHDPKLDLCDVYKEFGKIHRVVSDMIKDI